MPSLCRPAAYSLSLPCPQLPSLLHLRKPPRGRARPSCAHMRTHISSEQCSTPPPPPPLVRRSPGRRYSCKPPQFPTFEGDRAVAAVSKRHKDLYLPSDFVKVRRAPLPECPRSREAHRSSQSLHLWACFAVASVWPSGRAATPGCTCLCLTGVPPRLPLQVRPTWQQSLPECSPYPIDRPIRCGAPSICWLGTTVKSMAGVADSRHSLSLSLPSADPTPFPPGLRGHQAADRRSHLPPCLPARLQL